MSNTRQRGLKSSLLWIHKNVHNFSYHIYLLQFKPDFLYSSTFFLLCKTADTYIWNCTSSLGIKHSYTSFKQQKGSFTGLDYLGSKWAASGPQCKMSFTSRSRKIKLYRRKISKSAFRLNCHFRLTCNFCLFVLFFCTIKFPFAFFATF